MNIRPEIVIFSLNYLSRLNTLKQLGIPFKEVQGCYKGTNEPSFIVNIQEDKNLNTIIDICAADGQESLLILDSQRIGSLRYLKTGESVRIGQLRSVTALEASKLDNWTYDPETLTYWSI